MPRIPVHSVEDAPQQSRQRLQQLRDQFGTVLNIHGEMAHSPVVLAAYGGILDAITEHGTFDAPTREAIALAVGNTNDRGYCQSAHTQGAKAAGWSETELTELFAPVLVNIFTNYFNHYARTELDIPAAPAVPSR
ncbi:carboxymuconolactone decarboxylase family protein [Actinopolyspora mortivallis]|uniref:Alkylhydroperoxidase n=1 Tax=Actinopolyspora mortivallis TaxID=33906 RepID=A0A2T0GT55_ACTMO|nr:carboxymuconolactone decarboxylase family protein [Actinopolyspora mortivallis]PRW62280.1 alkylhydroperoxidase [Actinopolyspora mortivallis]